MINNDRNEILDKIAALCIGLLFTFPLLPLPLASFLTMLMILTNGVAWFFRKEKKLTKNWIWLVLFGVLPVFYLVELFNAIDFQASLSLAMRKILLIAFPLGFYFASSSEYIKARMHWSLLIFSLSVIVLVLKTLMMLWIFGIDDELITSGGWAFALRHTIENISKTHPTYFSLFVGFAISYLVHGAVFKWKKQVRLLAYFGAISLFLVLVALAARIVILGMLLVCFSFILFEIHKWKTKLIFAFCLLGLLASAWFLIPSLKERTSIALNETQQLDFRSTIYQCDVLLAKENWLWGIQAGQIQPALNTCYFFSNPILTVNGITYNTHNEYFNVLIGKGVFALFAFILLLAALIRASFKSVHLRYLMILCVLAFLTENVLDRQLGLFFFGLLTSSIIFFRKQHSNSI